MKAIRLHAFGGPENFRLETLPDLVPGDDQLLIAVHAIGINPVDTKIREGKFPRFQATLPAIIGRDICGVVAKVGRKLTSWFEGEPVFGMLDYSRGAYAEQTLATPRELTRKPSTVDPVHAAAIPVAGLTAWQALFDQGKLQAGQRVLIHGGAGGVGHFAIQFAVSRGVEVIATSSQKDLEFVLGLGAKQAIDYHAQKFENEVRDLDVVLDLIGGETRQRSWSILKPGGLLVSTLGLPLVPPNAPAGVSGREVMVEARSAQLDEIGRLVESGKVKVHVEKVFPLAETAASHEFLEQGHVQGKIVLSTA